MVGSLRPRVDGGAGNGKDLAVLFQGHSGGDQRAGPGAGLDDDNAPGDPRNQTVATREMAGLRLGAGGDFGNDRALLFNLVIETCVFLRVDHIDAAGQTGYHQQTARAQIPGDPFCEVQAVGGRIAGADDGDRKRMQGFFTGQIMKATKGQADGKTVAKLLAALDTDEALTLHSAHG